MNKNLILINGVAGAGKTTLSKILLDLISDSKILAKYTTRKRRPNEESNLEFIFIENDEFSKIKSSIDFTFERNNTIYALSKNMILQNFIHHKTLIMPAGDEIIQQIKNWKSESFNLITVMVFASKEKKIERILNQQMSKGALKNRIRRVDTQILNESLYQFRIENEYDTIEALKIEVKTKLIKDIESSFKQRL